MYGAWQIKKEALENAEKSVSLWLKTAKEDGIQYQNQGTLNVCITCHVKHPFLSPLLACYRAKSW